MSIEQKDQQGMQHNHSTTTEGTSRYSVGVINNPCGAAKCAALDIDPEHFLSECCAPVCWDCWFVAQKIQL